MLYTKDTRGRETYNNPSKYLLNYLSEQGIDLPDNIFVNENLTINQPTDIETLTL